MSPFDSPEQAVQSGEVYIKNAEDALGQKVIREDQLYIWENQLQAIDEFLADTEDMDGSEKLSDVRGEARACKVKLERSIAEFFDEPVEDEDPATNAVALLAVGADLIEEAETALKRAVKTREDSEVLDDALIAVKQWLADTELLAGNEVMQQARSDMKVVKTGLEDRVEDIAKQFAEADDGKGDDD